MFRENQAQIRPKCRLHAAVEPLDAPEKAYRTSQRERGVTQRDWQMFRWRKNEMEMDI